MPSDAINQACIDGCHNNACLDDRHKNALQEPAAKGRFNN